MTTIVLTVIGILLAAVAAVMLFFYGGGAFDGGAAKAQAATLLNAGENVESATRGYATDVGGLPSSLSDLQAGAQWLTPAAMGLSGAATGAPVITSAGGSAVFEVPGVTAAVCTRVNKAYQGATAPATPPTTMGSVRRGCYLDPAAGADSGVYFVVLGAASGASAGGAGSSGGSSSTPSPSPAPAPAPAPSQNDGLAGASSLAALGSQIQVAYHKQQSAHPNDNVDMGNIIADGFLPGRPSAAPYGTFVDLVNGFTDGFGIYGPFVVVSNVSDAVCKASAQANGLSFPVVNHRPIGTEGCIVGDDLMGSGVNGNVYYKYVG